MSEGIGLVCFDWGGVILRICRSWGEALARAGLDERPGLMNPEFAAERRVLAAAYQIGEVTCEEFFGGISRAMRGLYSADEVRRVHDAWLIEEYPGVDGVIRRLHARGVRTGLLSNTNQRHWERHLPGANAAPDFPTIGLLEERHASHLFGLAKPDRRIFESFAREVGEAPGRILFFDDLAENVEAARDAGWRAVLIDHEGDTSAQLSGVLSECFR
ncbi:MAG: HAD-IA family hydrolase [Phycisphaeraceae bacterium]|nr:HAD-IA family hydrolase [Phycisphaeraceae bacterium]